MAAANVDPLLQAGISSEVGANVLFVDTAGDAGAEFLLYAEIVHFPRDISTIRPAALAPVDPAGAAAAATKSSKDEKVKLVVKDLGKKHEYNIKCSASDKISQVKKQISEQRGGVPAELQDLLFDGKRREGDETLADCKIVSGSTLHLVTKKKHEDSGQVVIRLPLKFLDPQYNYNFDKKDGDQHKRGKHVYYRPVGARRFAIKVNGRYPDGDAWLNTDEEAWPVCYHGTHRSFFEYVLREIGPGHTGLPTTQHPDMAWKHARAFIGQDGKSYKVIFQHRVHPDHFRAFTDQSGQQIWLVEGVNYMRPYSICIREDDSQPARTGAIEMASVTMGVAALPHAPAAFPHAALGAFGAVAVAPPAASAAGQQPSSNPFAPPTTGGNSSRGSGRIVGPGFG